MARDRKRDRAKRFVLWYKKSHPCVDCGESDPIVLEFDHRDPEEKTTEVSSLVARGAALPTIFFEIQKCDSVCANCHKRRTARMFGWFNHVELNGGGAVLAEVEVHPEVRSYTPRRNSMPTDDEAYFEWVTTSGEARQEALYREAIRKS